MKCKLCTMFRLTIVCLLFSFAFGKKGSNSKIPKARKAAGNSLKQDYDSRHQFTPKTLSVKVLYRVYKMEVEDKGGIPTMQIMYKLDNLRRPPRLQTLLMFEKMDQDSDGSIDASEFVELYGPASSAPHRVFRSLLKLLDHDNNDFISLWEVLRGFDSELTELGKKAEQKFRAMHGNGDSKVSEEEFITFMAYLGANSIGKVKKEGNA